ncbi:epoxide hydrolase family protein [Martelella alba]|uniref:Epoxide hydrolase n=1 Tax=Martelella alba TaxID=2590451 RepID=A0ABY2SUR0_9HYPH|nr:epoxide hydrolase family protein [Martelella alba]TKI08871.1 epoxide hydrolase [Martelella alba]
MAVQNPFKIHIPEEDINDLKKRLVNIRWGSVSSHDWDSGTPSRFLKPLMDYWEDGYDWREQERLINQYPQYMTEIEGHNIHYFYIKGKGSSSVPLILTHGWPDSFMRYIKLIPYLNDPERYGGRAQDSFDLIIPSLSGFGFSSCAGGKSLNNAQIAHIWFKLMTNTLGYHSFFAHGGDIGSGVTRYLAQYYPEHLRAIHVVDVGIIRDLLTSQSLDSLTAEQQNYKKEASNWMMKEGGYMSIQATKPQTLSFGLNNSPVGLAAWIVEKFNSWGNQKTDLFERFQRDDILTNIALYWFTQTIGSSVAVYRANTTTLPSHIPPKTPIGVSCFKDDILLPPRDWVSEKYNLCYWSELQMGGHFAAMEYPEKYANELKTFFRKFR